MAVITGAALVLEYHSPEMLFEHFTWRHQVAFTSSVGHWVVAFAEESGDCTLLGRLYLLHHAIAATLFAFCLGTGHLSMVGVCGLLFELPVALLNIRQGLYIRQLLSAVSISYLRGLWASTLIAAIVARGGPLVLYCVSRNVWPLLWTSMPEAEIRCWEVGVNVFAAFSCGWFAQLLVYRFEDLRAHQAYDTLLLREQATGSHTQTGDVPSREESLDKCPQDVLCHGVRAQGTSSADEERALQSAS